MCVGWSFHCSLLGAQVHLFPSHCDMGPSFDYVPSILFCAEGNDSILGFDEEECGRSPSWAPELKRCDFGRDCFMDFPLQSDECLSLLVEREMEHLPREDYGERLRSGALDLAVREGTIDWMWKVDFSLYFSSFFFFLNQKAKN